MAKNATIGVRVVLSVLVLTAAACAADPGPANLAGPMESSPPSSSPAPDPAAVAANELGVVPVLMYHQLAAVPDSEYDQTPAKFRAELERLYRENYRPVTAAAYVSGAMNLPAGTHPVVLTFDDSTRSQLAFAADGQVAPDTVIGILEQFRTEHPDFAPTATFYVNNQPFGDDPRALSWLAAHGYEIGATPRPTRTSRSSTAPESSASWRTTSARSGRRRRAGCGRWRCRSVFPQPTGGWPPRVAGTARTMRSRR
ncbi:hypothetical protein ACFYO1_34870 [Nocardia sp. NPDC006044]|uniref:hypothetical protein n=1 Tax=Nocardia sp. NPDC006044 TaxID=3364306 RepID=UPI0036C13421